MLSVYVTYVDIGKRSCVAPAAVLVSKLSPGRHRLRLDAHPHVFDLAFIDGCHDAVARGCARLCATV